jgi:hypothetical protein
VVVIGYPNHGKTVFLAGLFWDSFFALSESFGDGPTPYAVRAVNQRAAEVFFGNALTLSRGELPPSSPRTPPEPAVLEFSGIPNLKGKRQRTLITFYDIPGEAVSDEEWLLNHAPFLPRVHDIVFLFDPTRKDFEERALQAADLRDKIYRLVAGSEKKSFIIALSKMDELRHEDSWADIIAEFWPGGSPRADQLGNYWEGMERISRHLRDWWAGSAPGGRGFVARVPKNTRFCGISSLGSQPVWLCTPCGIAQEDSRSLCAHCGRTRPLDAPLRLAGKPQPFRVRDPLFWIFRGAGAM